MRPQESVATFSLVVVLLTMLAELRVSKTNERRLRRQGAIEPADPVYGTMRWAYPGTFVAMAIEGALFGPMPGSASVAGAAVFVAAKALKFWAISSLQGRWTYRVLVMPGVPLITEGPYRLMRHPNYLAVIGELMGMALLVGARVTGPIGGLFFAALLRRRITAEDRALRGN